jgi:ACS family D-galactonate transporter-like MFS transporter
MAARHWKPRWDLIIAGLIGALASWRAAFLVAGLGTMACGAFAWFYVRNHPHEHGSANQEERSHIQDGLRLTEANGSGDATLSGVFRSPSIWMLFVGWFCFNSLW